MKEEKTVFPDNGFINILFYSFVFFLPFMDLFTLEIGGTLKLSDSLALVLIGIGIFHYVYCWCRGKKVKIYFSVLSLPLILFLLVCLISVIQTKRFPLTEVGLKAAVGRNTAQLRSITTFGWALFSYFIFLLVINIVKTKDMLFNVLRLYLISSFVICLYGLYQLLGHLFGFSTGIRATEASWLVPRINATMIEPIIFANYLISAIVLALALFLSKERIMNRNLAGLVLLVQAVNLILTFSVSGLIACGISIIVLFMLNRKYFMNKIRFVYLILIVLLLVRMIFILMPSSAGGVIKASVNKLRNFKFYSRMSIEELKGDPSGYSQQERVWLGTAAVKMFKQHPILGVGVGNFGFHYNAYRPRGAEYRDYLTLANNQYLEILAETGIAGMICFLYLVFSLFRLIVMAFRKISDYTLRFISGAFGAIFIGWAIQYCFFSTLYIIYIWALLGISVATVRLAINDEKCALP